MLTIGTQSDTCIMKTKYLFLPIMSAVILFFGGCASTDSKYRSLRNEHEQLKSKAIAGDPDAQFEYANAIMKTFLYARTINSRRIAVYKRDPVKALKFLRNAAEKGHLEAQATFLKWWLRTHNPFDPWMRGVDLSLEESMEWNQKALGTGDAQALVNLGHCYYLGRGVEKDMEKAASMFLKGGELGHIGAAKMLSDMYEKGIHFSKDRDVARAWKCIADSRTSTEPAVQVLVDEIKKKIEHNTKN